MKVNPKDKVEAKGILKEMMEDSERAHILRVTAQSEGGTLLVTALIEDVMAGMENLMAEAVTATHPEMVAMVLNIRSKLELARTLSRAAEDEEIIDEEMKKHLL